MRFLNNKIAGGSNLGRIKLEAMDLRMIWSGQQ